SGHHAIAQWLSHQISQPVCFLNLVVPYLDPFLSARDPTRFGRTGRFMPYEDSIEDIERVRHCPKQGLLIDYQDIPLPVLAHPQVVPDRENTLGRSRARYHLLVLRDPFNCAASRLARYRKLREA